MEIETKQLTTSNRPVRKGFQVRWTPLLFLLPSIAVFLLFKYYLIFSAVYISLFDYDVVYPPGRFVWLENYLLFLKTETFWLALKNTFIIFLLSVAVVFWVPIVQAVFLSEIRRANGVYRVLYQIPAILPGVAGALLWKWMYNPDRGLFNYLLGKIGLGPYGWLNDMALTKFAIVLPGFFASGGVGVLLYYAAIKSIPSEIFESAKIDGCGPWRRLLYIVLPNIRFVIFIQFITFMSGVLLTFDNIFIFTQGGPADASLVVSLLIQRSAFEQSNYGMSSALSFFMFVLIALLTVIQFKLQKEED